MGPLSTEPPMAVGQWLGFHRGRATPWTARSPVRMPPGIPCATGSPPVYMLPSRYVKPSREHPIALHRDHGVGAGAASDPCMAACVHEGAVLRKPEQRRFHRGCCGPGVPSAFRGGHQRELMQEGLTDPIDWVPSGSGGWEVECQPSYPPPSHAGLPTPARVL